MLTFLLCVCIRYRYSWLKKHLLEFEDRLGNMFPQNWEVSERITVQFCHMTREQLSKILVKRKTEIDVKLLLYAIQKTSNFENLLSRRFTGITLRDGTDTKQDVKVKEEEEQLSPFAGLIGKCFIPYLYIYIESIDRNLADLIERFQNDDKTAVMTESTDTQASVLPSCADLFVFYKKSMVQCTQLSKGMNQTSSSITGFTNAVILGQTMLDLTKTFQKYLREYAVKLLQNSVPKIEVQTLGSSVQSLTRDFQKMSTSGLIQNFSSLLKEGETVRFTSDEIKRICCILTTSEYCLETTQQLQDKLREKTEPGLAEQINLSQEQDNFHRFVLNLLTIQSVQTNCH